MLPPFFKLNAHGRARFVLDEALGESVGIMLGLGTMLSLVNVACVDELANEARRASASSSLRLLKVRERIGSWPRDVELALRFERLEEVEVRVELGEHFRAARDVFGTRQSSFDATEDRLWESSSPALSLPVFCRVLRARFER